jgi:cytochrome c oxidase subunit II
VTTETCTFSRPGEYLLLCHEYCGRLHHTMSGKVVVK